MAPSGAQGGPTNNLLRYPLARKLHQLPEFWARNECAGRVQDRKALVGLRLKGMGAASVLRTVQKPASVVGDKVLRSPNTPPNYHTSTKAEFRSVLVQLPG